VHTDHLNAPRRITRPSDNAMMWRWDSDPFGATQANQNPAGLGVFVYNLRMPGQFYDVESGHNYNYFRDYDPATGKYIQSDPWGLRSGVNTYAYAAGNPLRWIDPLGLWPPGFDPETGGLTSDAQSALDTWNVDLQLVAEDIKCKNYRKWTLDQELASWAANNYAFTIGQGPFPGLPPVDTPPPPLPGGPQLAPVPIQPIP
jgi:RHS repeat-associated protein